MTDRLIDKNSNILIVGAGPAGLTAATELLRNGYQPRIIDRKDAASPLSRAVGISAHSLELLKPSGATDRLLAEGFKIRDLHVHHGGHVIGTLHLHNLEHPYNFLLALPQNRTEEIIADALQAYGGTVEYGAELTSLRIKDGKALVRINDAPEEDYDLVIGADGVRSAVREALEIPFIGYDYKNRWSIADFESADYGREGDMYLLPGGHIRFVIKIGETRYRAVADEPEALDRIPVDFYVDKIHREGDFLISIRQAETYQKHPVYLAGDAAHVHSPAGARGMNLGIEDACELVRCLIENELPRYTSIRHPVGKRWMAFSERLAAVTRGENLPLRAIRRVALGVTSRLKPLQKPILKRMAGLIE